MTDATDTLQNARRYKYLRDISRALSSAPGLIVVHTGSPSGIPVFGQDLDKLIDDIIGLDLTNDQSSSVDDLVHISTIREAVANYMHSEGCSCCQSSNHLKHELILGKLLNVEPWEDDELHRPCFTKYRTLDI